LGGRLGLQLVCSREPLGISIPRGQRLHFDTRRSPRGPVGTDRGSWVRGVAHATASSGAKSQCRPSTICSWSAFRVEVGLQDAGSGNGNDRRNLKHESRKRAGHQKPRGWNQMGQKVEEEPTYNSNVYSCRAAWRFGVSAMHCRPTVDIGNTGCATGCDNEDPVINSDGGGLVAVGLSRGFGVNPACVDQQSLPGEPCCAARGYQSNARWDDRGLRISFRPAQERANAATRLAARLATPPR
jgi:hypothetical protein